MPDLKAPDNQKIVTRTCERIDDVSPRSFAYVCKPDRKMSLLEISPNGHTWLTNNLRAYIRITVPDAVLALSEVKKQKTVLAMNKLILSKFGRSLADEAIGELIEGANA